MQQRRAEDTGTYRRRYRAWLGVLVWLLLVTVAGSWWLLNESDRQRQDQFEERFTICREDEVIKRILRDDVTEQIAQEEAVLEDPSILPDYIEESTRLSLARHQRQLVLLEPRNCFDYARQPSRPLADG